MKKRFNIESNILNRHNKKTDFYKQVTVCENCFIIYSSLQKFLLMKNKSKFLSFANFWFFFAEKDKNKWVHSEIKAKKSCEYSLYKLANLNLFGVDLFNIKNTLLKKNIMILGEWIKNHAIKLFPEIVKRTALEDSKLKNFNLRAMSFGFPMPICNSYYPQTKFLTHKIFKKFQSR